MNRYYSSVKQNIETYYLLTLVIKMYSESWIFFCKSVDRLRECIQVVLKNILVLKQVSTLGLKRICPTKKYAKAR